MTGAGEGHATIHPLASITSYAGGVERSCHRPGCGRTAASALAYDLKNCRVWLEDIEADESPERQAERDGQLLLCSVHSDRFSAPQGWTVIDHRNPARSLWIEQPGELPARQPAPDTARRRVSPAGSDPEVDAPPRTLWDPTLAPERPKGPDPTSMKLLGQDHAAVDGSSLGISFDADTPLLRRAFQAARRAS